MVRSQCVLQGAATTVTVLVTKLMCAGHRLQQQLLRCWRRRRRQQLLRGHLDRRLVVVLAMPVVHMALVVVAGAVVVRVRSLMWQRIRRRCRLRRVARARKWRQGQLLFVNQVVLHDFQSIRLVLLKCVLMGAQVRVSLLVVLWCLTPGLWWGQPCNCRSSALCKVWLGSSSH